MGGGGAMTRQDKTGYCNGLPQPHLDAHVAVEVLGHGPLGHCLGTQLGFCARSPVRSSLGGAGRDRRSRVGSCRCGNKCRCSRRGAEERQVLFHRLGHEEVGWLGDEMHVIFFSDAKEKKNRHTLTSMTPAKSPE